MISNTPSPRNLNLNTTTTNANYCTDSPTWVGAGSTRMDCIAAVQHLYDVEVKRYNWQDFEFLSERAKKREEDSMQTPRKYSVGSCTLAIVMLNFFSDGELPGGVEGPFASRDVTSFYELWQAASKIEAVCLLHAGKPGWAAEGGREAIGVFLWSTDSPENERVPSGEPISPSLSMGAANGSIVFS